MRTPGTTVSPKSAILIAMLVAAGCSDESPHVGRSAAPLTVSPPSLDFGSAVLGQPGAVRATAVEHTTPTPVNVTSVSVSCADFVLDGMQRWYLEDINPWMSFPITTADLPVSVFQDNGIEVYQYLEIDLRFQPQSLGAKSCNLVIGTSSGPLTVPLTGTAVAPVLTLVSPNPASLAFGSRRINTQSTAQNFTIRNDGNAPLTLSAPTLSANSDDWVVTLDTATTLAAGATRSGTVAFAPKASGAQNATLTINSNDPADPTETIALTGTGTTATVSATPSPLSFGAVTVGQSATSPVTVQNTAAGGGAVALTISGVTITGTHAANFSVTSPTFPQSVSPGSSVNINVRCAPSAAGTRSATLTIDTDADNTPQDPAISLTCLGTKPDIAVSPGSINFGNVAPGASVGQNVTISNANNASTSNLHVTAIAITGTNASDYSFSPPPPYDLPPNGSQVVGVTFQPPVFGARTATLTITSDDQETPSVAVALSGTGSGREITLVTPSGGALAFGDVPVGSISSAQTVTVRNDGNTALTVSAASLFGTNAGQFGIASGSTGSQSVAAGATASWTITCGPTSGGAKSATFRIASNDADEPNTDIGLTCSGTQGSLAVSSPSIPVAFANTDVGSVSAEVVVTLRNSGTANVTITGQPTLPGGSPFEISTALSSVPVTLVPNGTTTLGMRFRPTADGIANDTLTVPYDSTSLQVGLTGVGRVAFADLVVASPTTPVQFATTRVGEVSPSVVVTVENVGNEPLTINSAAIVNPSVFEVVSGLGTTPLTVAAGATRMITLQFRPVADGDVNGQLEINWDATSLLVPLVGPGRVAVATASPDEDGDGDVDLGAVCVGQPRDQRFSLQNTGTASFMLTGVTIAESGFSITPVSPASYPVLLTPAAEATFDLTVDPPLGDLTGTITITTDIPAQPSKTIDVAAVGLASGVGIAPAAGIDFGSVDPGATSSMQPVTLTNCESSTMTISAVSVTGADAPEFAISSGAVPPPDVTLPPTETAQWELVYEPADVGASSATFHITHDLPVGGGTLDVPLSGSAGSTTPDAGVGGDSGIGQPDAGPGGGNDGGNEPGASSSYYACSTGDGAPGVTLMLLLALALLVVGRRRR